MELILDDVTMPLLKEYSDAETERKRYLQGRIKELLTDKFRSNVLGLAGPNILTYFATWRWMLTKADSLLTSYEIDSVSYYLQNQRIKQLRGVDQKRISTHYGNIKAAQPERFIDLDFVNSWAKNESIIASLFKKQYTMPVKEDEKRAFNITVTTRNSGLANALQSLNDLLNTNLSVIDNGGMNDCHGRHMGNVYNLRGNSKEFSVDMFTYKDNAGAPMLNFLIQY